MADYVVMPKLGFDMREGVLVTWLKQVGDAVDKGDIVAEIESDKATLELESQVSGVLLQHLETIGSVVPVGANLAIVGAEGEDISTLLTAYESASAGAASAAEPLAEATSAATAVAGTESGSTLPTTADSGVSGDFPSGVKASPVARRVAGEHNVDLSRVNGSGPGGRIVKRDVDAFLATGAGDTAVPLPSVPGTQELPLTRLRQAIARRMTESKTTVPHFYVTTEIDMAPALALRKEINNALPEGEKVTVNDMIVKAAALTLRDYPNLNASFAGKALILHGQINVGSAVAVEGGLLTVVQHDTDNTPLAQVATDNRERIGRARQGKVRPEDVEGATFTVSNLGGFDVDHFIAIINPPDAAILAVGSARQVPVVVDGQLTVGTRMKVTISADHRVTDGAEAAGFLQAFKGTLETPLRLLL